MKRVIRALAFVAAVGALPVSGAFAAEHKINVAQYVGNFEESEVSAGESCVNMFDESWSYFLKIYLTGSNNLTGVLSMTDKDTNDQNLDGFFDKTRYVGNVGPDKDVKFEKVVKRGNFFYDVDIRGIFSEEMMLTEWEVAAYDQDPKSGGKIVCTGKSTLFATRYK